MFFFIAGIQPKTVEVDGQPRMCPSCGLSQARLVRVDHYFSAFFLPLFRVKKGSPVLKCRRCGVVFPEGENEISRLPSAAGVCKGCGRRVDPSFRFCPSCGARL